MFADRAKIYIRSGKGGDGQVSAENYMFRMAVLTAVTAVVEET